MRLVHVRENWSEGYLWQPEGRGGVIRLVPNPFLRWLASQKAHEKGVRERLRDELGDNLTVAVSALARKYPMGLAPGMAGSFLERKPEEAGSVRDYFGLGSVVREAEEAIAAAEV